MKAWQIILFSATALVSSSHAENRPTGRNFATRSEVLARHGMACTSQPLATQAALEILKQGGTAIDAAIAADAVLGVVEPQNCGVGGDLFAIVWDAKTKRLYGLNASGRSPYALTLDHFRSNRLEKIPERGPLTISTPGCVDGWFELSQKFGKLAMPAVLAPAIHYAQEGFPVSEVIANEWAENGSRLTAQPGFEPTYSIHGRLPRKGDIFRNPDLGATLQRIASGGREGFYKGETARRIDEFLRQHGGFLSTRDLAEHKSEWVEPVSTTYRGFDVWELPPNTQGIAALEMLNILEGYDLRRLGYGSKEHVHLFIEAKKLAFEDRAKFYGDPAFSKLPIKQLISKEYAAARRKLIDLEHAAKSYPPGDPRLDQGDTVYLTTADEQGNMVSLIQSLYFGFGSGVCPEGLGFALQNRGALFNLAEAHVNTYAPHKRPFHTIIPAFITKDGQPFISFGVMGGQMQPQGHVQIVMNLVDFGMGLQEAGDAPRVQHNLSSEPTGEQMKEGGQVALEFGFSSEVERDLVKLGH
jgi:gamma-glutamyltranspeptidase/glutathione hydrolase